MATISSSGNLTIVYTNEYGSTSEIKCSYSPGDEDVDLAFSIDKNSDGTYGPVYLVGTYNSSALIAEITGPSGDQFIRNVLMYDDSEFVKSVNDYIAKAKAVPKIEIPATNNTYMMPDLSKRIQITENIIYKCTGPGFFYRQHTNVEKEWSGKAGIKIYVSDSSDMSDAVLFLDTNSGSYGHDGQMFPIMPGTNTYICIQYVNYDDVWCLYFVPAYGSTGGLSQIGTGTASGSSSSLAFTKNDKGEDVPSRLLEILKGSNTTGGGTVTPTGPTYDDGDDGDTDEPVLDEERYWKIDFGEDFVPEVTNKYTGAVTQKPSGTVTSTPEVVLMETVDIAAKSSAMSKTTPEQHYQIWKSNLSHAVFTVNATSYTKKVTGTDGKTKTKEYNFWIVSVNGESVNASTYKTGQIEGGTKDNPTVVSVIFKLLTDADYNGET